MVFGLGFKTRNPDGMVLPPRNGLSLCAGAGGLDMGLMLAEPDFHTRCFVEWEEYPREALIAAQQAGYFAPAPIWDDVTTFDAKPLAGAIDTLLAGYPCQPFSQAGQRKGEDDERHLWPDIERIIGELGDGLHWCFFENVAGHLTLGLETVLRSLRGLGFTPAVGVFSAEEVGATHERQRVFIVAYRGHPERRQVDAARNLANRNDARRQEGDGRAGECRANVGHPARLGRGEGWAEHELRSGRNAPAVSGSELADRDLAGLERRARDGSKSQEGKPDRHASKCRGKLANTKRDAGHQGRCGHWRDTEADTRTATNRACPPRPDIFPPGPSDMPAWHSTLAMAPDLAPAVAFGDIARQASELAALVAAGKLEEAEAEPALCRMVDGMAARSRALRLLGNGVCPLAAGYAWRTLSYAHGLGRVDLGAPDREHETRPAQPVLSQS